MEQVSQTTQATGKTATPNAASVFMNKEKTAEGGKAEKPAKVKASKYAKYDDRKLAKSHQKRVEKLELAKKSGTKEDVDDNQAKLTEIMAEVTKRGLKV